MLQCCCTICLHLACKSVGIGNLENPDSLVLGVLAKLELDLGMGFFSLFILTYLFYSNFLHRFILFSIQTNLI